MSIAETLPDVRDGTWDDDGVQGVAPLPPGKEPYAAMLINFDDGAKDRPILPKEKEKNQRRYRRGVAVCEGRTTAEFEERWLPPGTMKEYYVQYCQQSQIDPAPSFPTFWRASCLCTTCFGKLFSGCAKLPDHVLFVVHVDSFILMVASIFASSCDKVWASHFSFMKFRQHSSHAECSECIRHKAVIAKLAHHLSARKMQQTLLHNHLKSQFQDRVTYWTMRGVSRSRSTDLLIIQDGMDQAKFMLPRSRYIKSKSFENMMRPKLHCAAALCHGRHLAMYISPPDLPKDSNSSAEMFLHSLHLVSQSGVDLSACRVCLQADNTSREVKNGITMRLISSLVSDGIIAEGKMCHLRTGHSHEDIDQIFGQCAAFMSKHLREAQTSDDVIACLQRFCDQLHRPFERQRVVIKLDQCRNWSSPQMMLCGYSSNSNVIIILGLWLPGEDG